MYVVRNLSPADRPSRTSMYVILITRPFRRKVEVKRIRLILPNRVRTETGDLEDWSGSFRTDWHSVEGPVELERERMFAKPRHKTPQCLCTTDPNRSSAKQ